MNDSIYAVSETGNDLETLRALRRKVAVTLDECQSARDIAALSRQLQSIITRIKEIETSETPNEIDDIISQNKGYDVRRRRNRNTAESGSFMLMETDDEISGE